MECAPALGRPPAAESAGPQHVVRPGTSGSLSAHRIEHDAQRGDCLDRGCERAWSAVCCALTRHRTAGTAAVATLIAAPVAITGLVFLAKGDVTVGLSLTIPAAGTALIVWSALCCVCHCAHLPSRGPRSRYDPV